MEAQIVMQGEQLLYTNQFDELTYNADKIVQLTPELDYILKRFSYSFSSKDSALIINKNLTAFLYWLVIDALYFVHNTSYEVDKINHVRKKRIPNKSFSTLWGQLFQEEKFIIKMRLLAMRSKQHQSLSQIRQTTTEELIELFEKQHKKFSEKNDQIINVLSSKVLKDKQNFNEFLKTHQVTPQDSSPLMAYYNFQKQMIREWMDQVQRKKFGMKCQICSRTDRLIKCKECDMQVHPSCYPKLPKDYADKQFLCQNCQKKLDETTSCIYCPIKGGHFLEVEYSSQKRTTYTVLKAEGATKLRIKKKLVEKERNFIHLSCSLWHPQLEYNISRGMIEYIHRVDRKKTQNSCYECGTNLGVTIPCANQNCRRFYHPECARRIDLSTCIINAKNKLLIELYCQRHKRPYIYEILKENILNNLKEIKKLYEGIDHEIKRMISSSFPSDRKIYVKNQDPDRYQWCLYCQKTHEDLSDPIVNCWKCYNWYHKRCGGKCLQCEQKVSTGLKP